MPLRNGCAVRGQIAPAQERAQGRRSQRRSGDAGLHLDDLLAAGKRAGTCDGDDFRAYVCVRLLDASGTEVTPATAAVTWQLERPPPSAGVSVSVGEDSLHVSWSAGTTTNGETASTSSYGVFAAAGGVTARPIPHPTPQEPPRQG